MNLSRINRRHVIAGAAAAGLGALPTLARAQAFPSRPIRYICPWPPGGATDVVLRAVAESAARVLGQTVIIDNKPGAGGTLGANELVNAKPDGYVLSQLPISVFRIPHMQKVPFDTLRDFTWIACLTGYTFGLVVPADSPLKSIKDLVAFAKANPGKFSYGSTGTGTSPHLAVEEFAQRAGIELNHIPFKGNADNMQAVLGGHTMAASDSTGWAPHVDAGKLRLLATYGSKRTRRWPSVPTLDELGYQTVSDSPFGVCGPRGMDPALVKTLQDAFKKTLDDPAVIATLDKYDQPVIYLDTEGYTKYARDTFAAEKATIERLGLAGKSRAPPGLGCARARPAVGVRGTRERPFVPRVSAAAAAGAVAAGAVGATRRRSAAHPAPGLAPPRPGRRRVRANQSAPAATAHPRGRRDRDDGT
jgi:tripartite-type tricarboxylate transporter receptor subunit TctC